MSEWRGMVRTDRPRAHRLEQKIVFEHILGGATSCAARAFGVRLGRDAVHRRWVRLIVGMSDTSGTAETSCRVYLYVC